MKKDPFDIIISIIYSLNLLEENREYNINELKSITVLDRHWLTIQKYLKIIEKIQKYCPNIEFDDSKLIINDSKIYKRFSEKEKFIIYLFNQGALNSENAVPIHDDIDFSEISGSINYLYNKTEDNRFYLKESGLNIYRLIKQNLSDLIFNDKKIDDVFENNKGSFLQHLPKSVSQS